MRERLKRAAVAALAGVMTMGMLAGCGEKKLDGTQTVATVNGTDIPMGVLSIMVRQSQAQAEAMYASLMGGGQAGYPIWESEAEGGGTYGEQAVEDSLKDLETLYILKEKAADYKVEVTEEDQKAIAEAASQFMKANSKETIETLSVTEDHIKTYLELRTYQMRMHDAIIAEVDTDIPDEEAQQSSFSYVSISTADLEEKDVEAKKKDAQKILDEMKKDPEADFDETVKSVSEDYNALEGTFDTNEKKEDKEEGEEDLTSSGYPEEVISVLRTLKDGEFAPDVIETDTAFYVVRLNKVNDPEATENKKTSILNEKQNEFYADTTGKWLEEAEVTVDKKVLKTLELKDNHKFLIGTTAEPTETPEASEEAAEETTAEDEILEPVEETEEEPTAAPESDAEETETEKAEEETAETTVTPEPTEEAEK